MQIGIRGFPKLSSIYISYVQFVCIHAGGGSAIEAVGLAHAWSGANFTTYIFGLGMTFLVLIYRLV